MSDNKAFCVLPWVHLHVMPDSSVIPCCVSPYDDHYGNVSKEKVEEIWNSEKFLTIRKQMLAGELPPGCARCHSIESSGFQSMRNKLNDYFARHVPELKAKTSPEGRFEEIKMRYIDIRFSNLCNFKCRGCSPALSSAWYDDHQALFNYTSDKPKVSSISVDSPDFWNRFQELALEAEVIYFGGGEPLITKEHFDLLRLLISKGNTNIDLSYNTNLSTLTYGNNDLTELWSHFKSVQLGISLDDIGPRAEYFRSGTKWNVIEKNMRKLRDEFTQIHRYVNVTVSAMNVFYLPELYSYLLSEKLISPNSFSINLLLDPHELRMDALPMAAKVAIQKKLKNFSSKILFLGHSKTSVDINNVVEQMMAIDNSHLFETFKERTKKLDAIRGESFAATYPELNTLLGNI